MKQIIDEGKLISFDELRILLHASGIREVEGVYMFDKKLSEEEVIRALQHLSECGVIEAGDTKFQIKEDIQSMLQIMGNPQNTYIWSMGEEDYFCYESADKIVVSTYYWKKKETLKLRVFSREAFEEWKEQIENDYSRC